MEFEFNADDFEERDVKILTLKSTGGFHIEFQKFEKEDKIRLYQVLYGEEIYVMDIDRHSLGDFIYSLEDLL